MQPTYLPWAGYFNLIQAVDVFVFLDDVQLEKQSWQTRNRILINGLEHILSVPIAKRDLGGQLRDVRVASGHNWQKKHWKTIESAYCKAPYFEDIKGLLHPVFTNAEPEHLCDITIDIIERTAAEIGLETHCIRASALSCGGARSEKLYNICEKLQCDSYLSPVGARDYLERDRFAQQYGVTLEHQQYQPRPYSQRRCNKFISHLSFVDVVANIGFDALPDYVR